MYLDWGKDKMTLFQIFSRDFDCGHWFYVGLNLRTRNHVSVYFDSL